MKTTKAAKEGAKTGGTKGRSVRLRIAGDGVWQHVYRMTAAEARQAARKRLITGDVARRIYTESPDESRYGFVSDSVDVWVDEESLGSLDSLLNEIEKSPERITLLKSEAQAQKAWNALDDVVIDDDGQSGLWVDAEVQVAAPAEGETFRAAFARQLAANLRAVGEGVFDLTEWNRQDLGDCSDLDGGSGGDIKFYHRGKALKKWSLDEEYADEADAYDDEAIAGWRARAADERIIEKIASDPYSRVYPALIGHFRSVQVWDWNAALVALHIVYAWMPTIPKLARVSDWDRAKRKSLVTCLSEAVKGSPLGDAELALVKDFANNSIVGGSKLLHFINPEKFPIWDSRVAKVFLNNPNASALQVNSIEEYQDYRQTLKRWLRRDEVAKQCLEIKRRTKIWRGTSNLRVAELVMFQAATAERAEEP